MATTTTNFGWDVPTSTDLVKNGATAISTLGQDIDTTMAELKGGTTGQVLSKTSNTDMDFTWVAQDDSNAIQNSIVDAKGDLIAATANDTPARLAVGNNGETLVADSSTSTGLRYQGSMAAGKNFWMNGGLAIWQRGTSFSTSGAYTADRWYNYFGSGTFTISRTTSNIPTGFQYGILTTSSGATAGVGFYQAMETANAIQLAGKTVTMSGYIQSSNSGTFSMDIGYSTNTDEPQSGTFTSIGAQTAASTTTSSRFSLQFAIPSNAKSLRLQITTPSLANGATATITGMQVEIGSVATNFTLTGGTIQGELAACQRYYVRFGGDSAYQQYGLGLCSSTTRTNAQVNLPVTMRVAPTSVDYSTIALQDYDGASVLSVTSLSLSGGIGKNVAGVTADVASGLTTGRTCRLESNNSTSAYLGFSAEL